MFRGITMRQPTLKQLRYLTAVAQHQHFGQAATASHVSQSTLSAGILELEEVLGVSLIERNNRKVFLTTTGEEVVTRARELLLDVEDLVSLCAGAGEPFHGRMRLGVIPTVAPFLLPELLSEIRDLYPEFKLYIREALSQPLLEALQAGELDVLLLALPFPAEQVETMPLFADEFLLACPESHPLATRSRLTSADLRGEALLLLEEGHCLRDHALEACELRDSQITIPYQATSLATIVQMVANDIGITLLPSMAVKAGITSNTTLSVRHFDQRTITRQIGLMWRKKTSRRIEFRQLGDLITRLVSS